MKGRGWLGWSGLLVAAILLPMLPAVSATPIMNLPAHLPVASWDAASTWSGTYAYVFGGAVYTSSSTHAWDQVLRLDPVSGSLSYPATLPEPRFGHAAVAVGNATYILGGYNATTPVRSILKFSFVTETFTVQGAQLPWNASFGTAVWDGAYIDYFGGCLDPAQSCHVLRYDPVADTIAQGAAILPTHPVLGQPYFNQEGQAVFAAPYVYIFGGSAAITTDPNEAHDAIFRYDPSADALSILPTHLQGSRFWASASWDGSKAYVFGGLDELGISRDSILTFDPATNATTLLPLTLPVPSSLTSTAFAGNRTYVFGGSDFTGRDIYCMDKVALACGTPPPDVDQDSVPDAVDNCRLDSNTDQADFDGDAIGNVCDPDADADHVADTADNCLLLPNPSQSDMDQDGLGDACDATPVPPKTGTIPKEKAPSRRDSAPYAIFQYNVAYCDPWSIDVDASASMDLDGLVVEYAWDFGDGGSAQGPKATHSYERPGYYFVRLTVRDDSGQSNSVGGKFPMFHCTAAELAKQAADRANITAHSPELPMGRNDKPDTPHTDKKAPEETPELPDAPLDGDDTNPLGGTSTTTSDAPDPIARSAATREAAAWAWPWVGAGGTLLAGAATTIVLARRRRAQRLHAVDADAQTGLIAVPGLQGGAGPGLEPPAP